MAPPLLNEYKIGFSLNRIFKNISGGPSFAPRDSGYSRHLVVFIYSITIFFLPFACSIVLQTFIGQTLISSVIMGGVFILLHTIVYFIATRYESRNTSSFDQGGKLAFLQDSEPALEGNPFGAAFKYLFVREKEARVGIIGQFIRVAIVGGYLGVVFYYLPQSFFTARYESSGIVLYIVVWIAVCMSHWPLLCKKPVEPNTYHTEDLFGLDDFSRLSHFACILIVIVLENAYPILSLIDLQLLWALVLLPGLWTIGLLPSFRIFLETGLERINTCILSGSPTMNNVQLSVLLVLKTFLGLLLPFYLFQIEYAAVALVTSTALACVFSSRIIPDMVLERTIHIRTTHIVGIEPSINRFKKSWPYIYLFMRMGIKIGLGIVFVTASFTSSQHPWTSSFALLVVIFTLLKKATREIQQARIPSIFPMFLNPIPFYGNKHKTLIKEIGFLHSVTSIPLDIITQSYIFLSLIPTSNSLFPVNSSIQLLDSWKLLMIFRAFSSVAHTPEIAGTDCCLNMAVAQLANLQPSSTFSIWWSNLDFGSQIFLIHVFKSIYLRFAEKSYFWIISLKHFLFFKKELHPSWKWWILPIFIISPITIIISSIIDTPSIPYLGLPLLLLSFPRPKRFWEALDTEYASGRDVPLYMSLAPTLVKELSKAISDGKLPTLDPGGAFLARFESRIMVIRGVEHWFEGMSSIITATELEPTSCHALEGLAVDDVLDKTLDPMNKTWTNHHLLNTLSPVGVLKTKGYLESQSITTGILTNTTYTNTFPSLCFKVLAFYLMKKMDINQFTSFRNAPINQALMTQVKTIFPVVWFDLVKQKSQEYLTVTKSMTIGRIEALNETLNSILVSVFIVMLGSTLGSNSTQLYLSVLFDIYKGKLAYSVQPDLRTWFQNPSRKPLRILCVKAFRYAFKYLYDASVLQEPIEDMQQLYASLEDMTSNWIVTVDPVQQAVDDPTEPAKEIDQGIENRIKGVFQLYLKKQGEPLRVRMLTQSDDCMVKIAKMNKEALMGIWANLTYELLYLTNDDDERFSIQAHQLLLRNLSVQIAFPPFGYPLWVAPAILNSSISLPLGSPCPEKGRLSQEELRKVFPEGSNAQTVRDSLKKAPILPLFKINPMQDEDLMI